MILNSHKYISSKEKIKMMIEKKIHSFYPRKLVFDPSSADRYNLFLAESIREAVKAPRKITFTQI